MTGGEFPQPLVADANGSVRVVPGLEALGMKAGRFFRLSPDELIPLPETSEWFLLPGRKPVVRDPVGGKLLLGGGPDRGPADRNGPFAVAAFLPPGYTLTHHPAYRQLEGAPKLPLFAYAACVSYKGRDYVAAFRSDRSSRHDIRRMDPGRVRKGIEAALKAHPRNRLVRHLSHCALVNACPNAKNFFLGRQEAPLPVSPSCNARCLGCISYQPDGEVSCTQPRLCFVPTPEEIAEVALAHLARARPAMVSFGQGCEGEPLMQADVIERAIRLIRARTDRGVIHMNTNAGATAALARLFDAGLQSIRISTNSFQREYYQRYYRPKGYTFRSVLESVRLASKRGIYVSVNYLTMPGWTDSSDEVKSFEAFLRKYRIHMVQWRNLNYDPLEYFKDLKIITKKLKIIGLKEHIFHLKKIFPGVLHGYFNMLKLNDL